jgi:hypothetical protein
MCALGHTRRQVTVSSHRQASDLMPVLPKECKRARWKTLRRLETRESWAEGSKLVHPGLLSLISPALHSVYSLSRSSPPVLLLPRRSVGFLIPCFLRAPVSLRSASSAIGTSSCPLDGYVALGVPARDRSGVAARRRPERSQARAICRVIWV